jgi:hypothetical protein
MLNEGTGKFQTNSENIANIISSIFLLSYFFLCFLTQYPVWKRIKRISIKNVENSYQDRQTSANSSNLILKFKVLQLFLASAPSQLIFLTQCAVWQLNKRIAIKNLDNNHQDRQASAKSRNLIFKFEDKIPALGARLSALISFFQVF